MASERPDPPTVLCFFSPCGHVVRGLPHDAAHDAMQAHYREAHSKEIDQIVAGGRITA